MFGVSRPLFNRIFKLPVWNISHLEVTLHEEAG